MLRFWDSQLTEPPRLLSVVVRRQTTDGSMAKKRSPAVEAARCRSNKVLRLNHVELLDEDIEWLAATERLTLWGVRVPPGLICRLEKLWWLDIRGGSAASLEMARGATKLQYLAVNQIRGMSDLSVVSAMTGLRRLAFYGLPKVTQLPLLSALANLEHASLGQMRGLQSLHGVLLAPKLRELQLVRKINVNTTDVDEIINHPTIKQFGWFAEGVPDKVWAPVVKKVGLPPARPCHAEEWFGLPDSAATNQG